MLTGVFKEQCLHEYILDIDRVLFLSYYYNDMFGGSIYDFKNKNFHTVNHIFKNIKDNVYSFILQEGMPLKNLIYLYCNMLGVMCCAKKVDWAHKHMYFITNIESESKNLYINVYLYPFYYAFTQTYDNEKERIKKEILNDEDIKNFQKEYKIYYYISTINNNGKLLTEQGLLC